MSNQNSPQEQQPISSLHHSFDVDLAAKYGIPEAIIIHHFQHWIKVNQRLNQNFHDGRTWSYQSLEKISAHFSYLSRDQVNRIIRKLVKLGVLIKGNYNKVRYDRTAWYAFVDGSRFGVDEPSNVRNRNTDMAKSPHRKGEIATPIPDTKTDTKHRCSSPARSARDHGPTTTRSPTAHSRSPSPQAGMTTTTATRTCGDFSPISPAAEGKKNEHSSLRSRTPQPPSKGGENGNECASGQSASERVPPGTPPRCARIATRIAEDNRLSIDKKKLAYWYLRESPWVNDTIHSKNYVLKAIGTDDVKDKYLAQQQAGEEEIRHAAEKEAEIERKKAAVARSIGIGLAKLE